MLERSAVVHALLADGLARVRSYPDLETVVSRLTLCRHEASVYLDGLAGDERPDVVYLDPMYPDMNRSALNKKEMRLLRELVGSDEDASGLLVSSLARARKRVAVKRPRQAPPIDGPVPSMQIIGRTTRYDIYRIAAKG
jgi:16S rRNA (guanine1516-N2)-methyltransferase